MNYFSEKRTGDIPVTVGLFENIEQHYKRQHIHMRTKQHVTRGTRCRMHVLTPPPQSMTFPSGASYAVRAGQISLVIIGSFNKWGGEGSTIPSPGVSSEQPLPAVGRHDPLHGRNV